MKNTLFLLLLLFFNDANAQLIIYEYCFDQSGNCADYTMGDPEPVFFIDTVSNPSNTWQIGSPQKSMLNHSYSGSNVIITDTVNTYPINDTSVFMIKSTVIDASSSVNWANFEISFKYFVDSDSLTDFGMIEFSPDNGTSWIDLINDSNYVSYLNWFVNNQSGIKPILTGTSNGWIDVMINMQLLGDYLNMQPGTTFIWRFSFISDSIQNNRDGLMFDDIYLEITPPLGIEENQVKYNKKLVRVTDLTGREVKDVSNTVLIYMYNDGTTEKVFKLP